MRKFGVSPAMATLAKLRRDNAKKRRKLKARAARKPR
jgi:hypothetical protein